MRILYLAILGWIYRQESGLVSVLIYAERKKLELEIKIYGKF